MYKCYPYEEEEDGKYEIIDPFYEAKTKFVKEWVKNANIGK